MAESEHSLYRAVGGFDTILALCRRWHTRCLENPEAAHPFEHELHPYHDERLAAYLAEAFGGPKLYTAGYGDETLVQRIHAGNGVHTELDEACLSEFEAAVAEVGISGEAAIEINAYFRRATHDQRAYAAPNATVPDHLPFNFT
jgi:hemoglobin